MKKIITVLVFILPVFICFTACNEEDSLPQTTTFTASNGTYFGVIHLSYGEINGAENFEVDRFNPEIQDWQNIGYTPSTMWDDFGYLLNAGVPTPGQEYQYRVRSHADGPGYSPYSEVVTGYAYNPQPVTITEVTRDYDASENTISWTDPNDYESLENVQRVEYYVYYAYEDNPDDFQSVGNTTNLTIDDYINSYEVDKVFIYKVVPKVEYLIHDVYGSIYSNYYDVESTTAKEGTGGDGPAIVSYTKTDLGTVASSGEAITYTELKQNGGNIYLGMLKDVNINSYGTPAAYILNGSSWTETGGSLPTDITNSTSIGKVGIAAGSSKLYMAALDLDSLYVIESDGSNWSANLASKNLGYDSAPSEIDIEVLDDVPYLAVEVYPDWDLKIYKWNGSSWETVGGDANGFITSGDDVFDVSLENYDGTLYLSYRVKNSEFNSTFHIKHLNGTNWTNDLEWTADNIMNLKIAKGGSDLYFIANSQSLSTYPGGVYKVTSTTSVENLITENDTWLLSPYDITVASDGNIIISSIKYESENSIYTNLNVYDGSNWKTISGDFTECKEPVSIHADETTIYYTYGDATNVTVDGDTKAIKSMKLEKQIQ